jgi:hypothetical protein
MFRLLGFLIGSAISIAVILLVTGLPEFHSQSSEIDQKRFDEAVEKLMARKVDAERMGQLAHTVAVDTDAIEQQSDFEVPQDHAGPGPDRVGLQQEEQATQVPAENDVPVSVQSPQWYSFWNPFRSQVAATGFVSRLEEVTGLDYRVVKVKSGVYEVAFPYSDDDERRMKLAVISDATGLELPDS